MEVKYRVLRPNFRARDPSSSQITEYAANLRGFIDNIRLMNVELGVIKIITNGIIPKMIFEERTQLDKYLLQINAERSEPLDLTKSVEDHFSEDLAFVSMVDRMNASVESND